MGGYDGYSKRVEPAVSSRSFSVARVVGEGREGESTKATSELHASRVAHPTGILWLLLGLVWHAIQRSKPLSTYTPSGPAAAVRGFRGRRHFDAAFAVQLFSSEGSPSSRRRAP